MSAQKGSVSGAIIAGGTGYDTMFGSTDDAGHVVFHDAWYIPGSAPDDRPLQPDILNVHHPGYYRGEESPTDWDNPFPLSTPSTIGPSTAACGAG